MRFLPGLKARGSSHHNAETKSAFDRVTDGLDAAIQVTVPRLGAYWVPRLYIACHGLPCADLPAVAERYGFEPAGRPAVTCAAPGGQRVTRHRRT